MGKFLKKWKKPITQAPSSGAYDLLQNQSKEHCIPKDVPKGHLVVYVGEEHKRFIIRVGFLQHPLFQELLDQAQQEYGFGQNSRLCIPCDEHIFHGILNYIGDQQGSRLHQGRSQDFVSVGAK